MSQETTRNSELNDILARIGQRFSVHFEPVRIADVTLEVLQITDMAAYVDKLVELSREEAIELPFWAKIWPACLLLSYYLGRLPAEGRSVLEIGAGVGLAGLYAARCGFDVTVSDIEEDALLFSRANVLRNGLEDRVTVRRVDFGADRLEERFDYIIGCEVLYREDLHRPLSKFLLRHLKSHPAAEVVLAMNYQRRARRFFQLVEEEFHVDTKVIGARGASEEGEDRHLTAIHRLKPKKLP